MNHQVSGKIEQPVVKAWSRFILSFSLFGILCLTLFPFDFAFSGVSSIAEILGEFDWMFIASSALIDIPGNILLFAPFGFGTAAIAQSRNSSDRKVLLIALFSGAALSLSIETLQIFTLSRFSSFVDILANTVGSVGGAYLFQAKGRDWLSKLELTTNRIKEKVTIWGFLGLAILWALSCLIVLLLFQRSFYLSNWDPEFPLLLGNERNGGRSWVGSVSVLYFADRAFSGAEIERAIIDNEFVKIGGENTIALFQLNAEELLKVESGDLPEFYSADEVARSTNGNVTRPGDQPWLETSAVTLNERIGKSSQFTLFINFHAGQTLQTGPARILSISTDAFNRNLTLGQEEDDLVIRVRTPITGLNGRNPELVIPDVFENSLTHKVVIAYTPDQILVYLDDFDNEIRFPFSPQMAALWKCSLKSFDQIYLVPISPMIISSLYFGLALAPLGITLIKFINTRRERV